MANTAINPRDGKTLSQSAARFQSGGKFRSTVEWKPEEWQKPLDLVVRRICLQAFLVAGNPTSPPIELTADQFAILQGGEDALLRAKAANNMHEYRTILKQYEERAIEFINRNRSSIIQSNNQ